MKKNRKNTNSRKASLKKKTSETVFYQIFIFSLNKNSTSKIKTL